jgi:hypothetical protein
MPTRALLPTMLATLATSTAAFADDKTSSRKGEVIIIEGSPPEPAVQARPPARWLPQGELDNVFLRKAPEYSETAILNDRWSTAWMLLDIDRSGEVTRVKFLKKPGNDLEAIAVRTALALKFEPARDEDGKPVRSWLAFPIEWPSYWWLIERVGVATGIPDTSLVPCRGDSAPNLDSIHPTVRDCDPPDWSLLESEPWQTGAKKKKGKKRAKK